MRAPAVALTVLLLTAVAGVCPAAGQILQPPPRSTTGVLGGDPADANRTHHELGLTTSVLGGYEDNLAPTGAVVADPLAPRRSGSTATVTTVARYWYGKPSRYLETNGTAYVNSFRSLGIRPLYGGNVNLRTSTELGSDTVFTASGGRRVQPTFTIAPAASTAAVAEGAVAPSDPTGGVSELRSISNDASGRIEHRWNVRHRTSVGYQYARDVLSATTRMTLTNRIASLGQAWDFRRSMGLMFTYEYADGVTQQERMSDLPLTSHTGNIGIEYRRAVSRTRNVTLSGGGGVRRVETLSSEASRAPIDYEAPTYYAGARLDVGRSWAISGDLRRSSSFLTGLTLQSFQTTTGSLWLGGGIGPRWTLSFNGTYSDGQAHETEIGSFETLTSTAQLQYAFLRCCSAVGSYSFYAHRLHDLQLISGGFPTRFDRNVASVGVTVWLPLYGTFASGRSTGGRSGRR